MHYKISEEVSKRTTKCQYDFKCLTKDECPGCVVELPIDGEHIFVKLNKNKTCLYLANFGQSSYICSCPIRCEIYRKYRE